MMRKDVIDAIAHAADENGIEPAALLAIVEVETAGAAFEQDGRTPQFLYERHVAWKQAEPRGCLSRFRAAGLAIPRWDRATQYRDERTSAQRLDLIGRAKEIDAEVACRSASWGLGQTMGFLAEDLGYANAVQMVQTMTGSVAYQIKAMVGELRKSHLIEPLNAHDWAHVARIYNGPGYAANSYDVRLADAYKRWTRRLAYSDRSAPPPPEQALSAEQIKQIQQELHDLGYHEVGTVDGQWGTKTTGAIAAFQAHEGVPVTGHYDDATRLALEHENPLPRPVPKERADATAKDLKEAGSRTIQHADRVTLWGRLKLLLGLGGGAGAAAGSDPDVTNSLQDLASKASGVHEAINSLGDIASWAFSHWWVFAIVAGLVTVYCAERIREARVSDHNDGTHNGGEDV